MLHPPTKKKEFSNTIFRNDDVAFDTNVEYFKKFCGIFHKYGFVQTHGIVLFGKCNDTLVVDGIPWIYEDITPDEYHDYNKCKLASEPYYIGENKELIRFLNNIPDQIALHGLYHSDYSKMSYEQQEEDISKGLELLHELFPNKIIDTFIAPFNATNEYTYEICKKYDLRISAMEGEHLEDRLYNGKGPIYQNELYRYHHHRFYPDTTFDIYTLNFASLEDWLSKFSYTYNNCNGRTKPSLTMLTSADDMFHLRKQRSVMLAKDRAMVLEGISAYLNNDDPILVVNDGQDNLLTDLWYSGFSYLYGMEKNEVEKNRNIEIASLLEAKIKYIANWDEVNDLQIKYKAIVINQKNNGDNQYIEDIFDLAVRLVEQVSYFFIISSEKNERCLIDIASKFNLMLMNVTLNNASDNEEKAFIFKRIKPKICLLCDVHGWAYDITAHQLVRYLSDEYDFDIKYVVDNENLRVNDYDGFQVFFWGEKSYQNNKYAKTRIIKQITSHRWQYDKPYGPISAEEFVEKYLSDAYTKLCPSKKLYDMLRPLTDNIFLCGEGYDSDTFRFLKARNGEMKICMVGNLKDPVKGVEEILKPSAEGYKLNLAQYMEHEKLVDFYNENDIYVVSSRHEANPLPLIESMACGCFPVASDVGIVKEIIRHKENGYIVKERTVDEFRKAFKWCEDNIDMIRNTALDRANEMYDTRRWEIMAENYREMYRSHMGRR